jgi:hypothetical protein
MTISDIAQAAYVISRGYKPVQIVPTDKNHSNFIFEDRVEITNMISEWKYSEERKYYIGYRELLTQAYETQKKEFGGRF